VDADSVTQRRQEPPREELHTLGLVHSASTGKKFLEVVGVFLDGARAAAFGELEEWCRPEGWTEPQVEEVLEPVPWRRALILLQLDEPHVGDTLQLVRCHPHALLQHGALLPEIRLTFVDEEHGIRLAVKAGKIELLKLGGSVKVPCPVSAAVADLRRGRSVLEALQINLHGRHVGGESGQLLHEVSEGRLIAHGWWLAGGGWGRWGAAVRCGGGRRCD